MLSPDSRVYSGTMKETIKDLETAGGGLSKPSKMPGLAYGTPAKECMIGSILREMANTVCSSCYARKGMYVFPVVQAAQYRRLETLNNLPAWIVSMTALLARKYAKKTEKDSVFRWHDSGDLRSVEHLSAIVQIAKNLPTIRFWLPTKEYGIVRSWDQEIPSNLVVRVSAPKIGSEIPSILGMLASTVGTGKGFACEAYTRGGKCGDCRAGWDSKIPSVDYPLH